MLENEAKEENDNAEKIGYVEFLRTTRKLKTNEVFPNNAQNLNNLPKKREHIGILGNSKSLPEIKLKRNESKNIDDEISSSTSCTFYEAVSYPNCSTNKNHESKLAGPPTVSVLPSILRPPKRWHKKAYYSLNSTSEEILNEMNEIIHSDLLHMPTICSPLIETTEANKYGKRANNYQNNVENSSKSKQ